MGIIYFCTPFYSLYLLGRENQLFLIEQLLRQFNFSVHIICDFQLWPFSPNLLVPIPYDSPKLNGLNSLLWHHDQGHKQLLTRVNKYMYNMHSNRRKAGWCLACWNVDLFLLNTSKLLATPNANLAMPPRLNIL